MSNLEIRIKGDDNYSNEMTKTACQYYLKDFCAHRRIKTLSSVFSIHSI